MKISIFVLGLMILGLSGCSPVTFKSPELVDKLSCEAGSTSELCLHSENPPDPEPAKGLKVVIHYLGEPTSPAAQFVNTQDVTLTLETQLPLPKEMILSDDANCLGTRQAYSAVVPAYTLKGTNGVQKVYAQIFSETANLKTACELASVFLDKNPPVVQNVKALIGKLSKDSVELSFDANDADSGIASVQCALKANDTNKVNCLSVLSADFKMASGIWNGSLPDGAQTVYATVKDKAGNELKDFPMPFSKDTTPPVLTWVDTPVSEISALPYELKFKYADAAGGAPKAFQCLDASGTFVTCTVKTADATNNIFILSFPSPAGSSVSDGNHMIGVKAQDQANLWSNELRTSFKLDRSLPSLKLDPIATYLTMTSLSAPFTATNNGLPYSFDSYTCELIQSGVVIKTIPTSASPCQISGLLQNEASKPYTLKVTGVKGTKTAQDQKSFNVDLTVPIVQILKRPNSPSNQSSSVFQVTANDPQSGIKTIDCYFDRGTAKEVKVTCSDKVDFNSPVLTDGPHRFEVIAQDQAGHKSTASYDWVVDLTAPAGIRISAPKQLDKIRRPAFEYIAIDGAGQVDTTVDPATGYKCTIDSYSPMVGCVSPWNLPASYPSLTDGSHKFYVQATDRAGNASSVVVYDFVVDGSAPVISIFPKVADAIIGDTTTINFKVEENLTKISQVICLVDGSPVTCNVSGVGTKGVTGNITVSNPNPTNGTPRMVVIKAINELNDEGQAQDTWNVNLGVNPFAKLKPALAVSQVQCLFCHTSLKSDLITDNGASKSGLLRFQYTGDFGTPEWRYNDFEHGEWMSHRSGLSSSIIEGTIYYQNQNYVADNTGSGGLQWWANLGMSAQTHSTNGRLIPRKFASLPSQFTRLTDYLELATRRRTTEELTAIRSGVVAGTTVKLPITTASSSDPLQTNLQPVSNLKIGAPTKAEIISKIPTGREFFYIPDDPSLSPKEAELLLGLKKISGASSSYYKVQGTLSCDGDLLINSSLFLKSVSLKTRRGCRIYTTGPIFVEAVSNRTAPVAGISYQDLSGEGLYNIQLSSASGVSMGLGKCKFPIADGNIPASLCSLGYRSVNSHNALYGTEIYNVATQTIVDASGNTLLEDAAYNPNATSADFQTWMKDANNNLITSVNRQVSFSRIIINAPMVHSRYSGEVRGSIVAGFMLPSLGKFSYTFDPVFQDPRVKVLPVLDLKNILYFQ